MLSCQLYVLMALIVLLHVSFALCAVAYRLCYCQCDMYPDTSCVHLCVMVLLSVCVCSH